MLWTQPLKSGFRKCLKHASGRVSCHFDMDCCIKPSNSQHVTFLRHEEYRARIIRGHFDTSFYIDNNNPLIFHLTPIYNTEIPPSRIRIPTPVRCEGYTNHLNRTTVAV